MTPETEVARLLAIIEKQQAMLERHPAFKEYRSGKDVWDKLSSLSTFLSTVVLGVIGIVVTNAINNRQAQRDAALKAREIAVAAVSAIPAFMPSLNGTDAERVVALMAIHGIGRPDIAASLAGMMVQPGALSAPRRLLDEWAQSGPDQDRRFAQQQLAALKDAESRLEQFRRTLQADGLSKDALQGAISLFRFDAKTGYTLTEARALLKFLGANETVDQSKDSVTGYFGKDGSVTIWPGSYGAPVYGIRFGKRDGAYIGSNVTLFDVSK